MNANNEFDKLVKDKLANAHPSVPKDSKVDIERMLVQQGLIKKDDRGRKYFYVAFSVIAFLAVLTATIFKFNSSKKDSLTEKSNSSENRTTLVTNGSEIEEVVKSEKNLKIENVTHANTNEKSSGKVERQIAEQNTKTKKGNLTQLEKAELNTKRNSGVNSKLNAEHKPKRNNNKEVKQTTPSGVALNNEQVDDARAVKVGAIAGGVVAKSQSMESANNKNSVDKSTQAVNNSPGNNLTGSESENNSNGDNLEPEAPSANSNLEIADTGQAVLASDSAIKQINVVNSDSVAKVAAIDSSKTDTLSNFHLSLEAFGGIQQTYMQNAVSSSGSQSSTQGMSNSEWVAGLKFSLFYMNHFTFGTGVNYSIHHSEISHSYNSFMYDSNVVTSVSYPAHIKTDFNVTEIPILIGYYFEIKKFAIHLESGISISMISNANSVLELDDSSQSINNFSGVSPVKSYSSFVGQFSLLYSISRRFQVFLQPSINVGLSEIFEGMPDKKINVVSGRTGLRMNF